MQKIACDNYRCDSVREASGITNLGTFCFCLTPSNVCTKKKKKKRFLYYKHGADGVFHGQNKRRDVQRPPWSNPSALYLLPISVFLPLPLNERNLPNLTMMCCPFEDRMTSLLQQLHLAPLPPPKKTQTTHAHLAKGTWALTLTSGRTQPQTCDYPTLSHIGA